MTGEFRIGQVVQLRSGGRAMTITDIEKEQVECSWHSEDGHPRCEQYPPEAIWCAQIEDENV
jgi:uncharacterized protein YodC (DUF2158 family)